MTLMMLELKVDREIHRVAAGPGETLADVLRDRLDLTATHIACDEGVCGSCTVLLDGRSARACLTLAPQAEGVQIDTCAGFHAHPMRAELQQAFRRRGGAQCGFCTPGMLAVSAEMLDDTSLGAAEETAIRERLQSVVCRCTGYQPIIEAIQDTLAWREQHEKSRA